MKYLDALPARFELEIFRLERVLGRGGFGITYLATDLRLERPVAVKEYLPTGVSARVEGSSVQPVSTDLTMPFEQGRNRFVEEARTLAMFDHPGIVRVYGLVEAFNTAYLVMKYEAGPTLDAALNPDQRLDYLTLADLTESLLAGLGTIHARGVVHRDVKPSNIILRDGLAPVLIDFGSARHLVGTATHTVTALVSSGFSPIEQYSDDSSLQGPWTDIYGAAATLYRAVTGSAPPSAVSRLRESGSGLTALAHHQSTYPASFLDAVRAGLAPEPEDRPKSVTDWAERFDTSLPTRQRESTSTFEPRPLGLESVPDEAPVELSPPAVSGSPTTGGGPAPASPAVNESTRARTKTLEAVDRPAEVATEVAAVLQDATHAPREAPTVINPEVHPPPTLSPGADTSSTRSRLAALALLAVIGAASVFAVWNIEQLSGTNVPTGEQVPAAGNSAAPNSVGDRRSAHIAPNASEAPSPGFDDLVAGSLKSDPTSSNPAPPSPTAAPPASRYVEGPEDRPASAPSSPQVALSPSSSPGRPSPALVQPLAQIELHQSTGPPAGPPLGFETGLGLASEFGLGPPTSGPEAMAGGRALGEPVGEPVEPLAFTTITLPAVETTEIQGIQTEIDRLLHAAALDVKALRLTLPPHDNAFLKYSDVLSREPGHPDALAGMHSIAQRYVRLGHEALDEAKLDLAERFVERGRRASPEHEGLATLASALAERRALASTEGDAIAASTNAPSPHPPASSPMTDVAASVRDRLSDGSFGPVLVPIPGSKSLIGRYEITLGEFRRFVAATDYRPESEDEGCFSRREGEWTIVPELTWRHPGFAQAAPQPVVCISHHDARAYVAWLSKQSGHRYRLPTEDQWQRAAGERRHQHTFWGAPPELACGYANGSDLSRGGSVPCDDRAPATAIVGSYQPNRHGVHDLLGNVWEWTQDCWEQPFPTRDAGISSCDQRIVRGGSWRSPAAALTLSSRTGAAPSARSDDTGFRVVRD